MLSEVTKGNGVDGRAGKGRHIKVVLGAVAVGASSKHIVYTGRGRKALDHCGVEDAGIAKADGRGRAAAHLAAGVGEACCCHRQTVAPRGCAVAHSGIAAAVKRVGCSSAGFKCESDTFARRCRDA